MGSATSLSIEMKFPSDIGVVSADTGAVAELEAIVVVKLIVRTEEQASGYAGFYVGDFR